jgi:hypothetical protein
VNIQLVVPGSVGDGDGAGAGGGDGEGDGFGDGKEAGDGCVGEDELPHPISVNASANAKTCVVITSLLILR